MKYNTEKMNEAEYEKYLQFYSLFFNEQSNAYCCNVCPDNRGFSDWQDRLPCGQWHCLVNITCRHKR